MSFIQGQFVSDFLQGEGRRGQVWGPAAFTLMYPAEGEAGSRMNEPHHPSALLSTLLNFIDRIFISDLQTRI